MTRSDSRARHTVLGIVALSLFAALFTRLWYLQVLTTDQYDQAAAANRTTTVILEAPRGKILDRHGNVLVDNRRTIQVQVDYQDFEALDPPDQSDLLRRLAAELTADQVRIDAGDASANDPGGDGPAEVATGAEAEGPDGEEEGAPTPGEGDEEGTTTTVPGEEVDPATLPLDQRPPPAGVATGASNPDGQGETRQRLSTPVTEEILRERIEDVRYSKFKPVPVANDVSEELEIYLRENAERFPTVVVERVTARNYRYGALLAHVLGYVAPVSEADLEQFQNDRKRYENDDEIGKDGIEREMERDLRGTPGRIVYEVDARNQPIREVEDLRRQPVPGDDVFLTIDINVQFLVEKGLAGEIARQTGRRSDGCQAEPPCEPPGGSSVALNPQTGEVLAMASYPTYDPNLFVGGISTRDYQAMADEERKDVHHDPLLNRAIAGEYSPGSTFKLFSAYAGLATGQITPAEPYNDTGVYKYRADCDTTVETSNCFKRNAGRNPNGVVRLDSAITVSSDTYFYQLGHRAWLAKDTIGEEGLQEAMRLWGLGSPTGVDLPGERAGRIPDPDWLWDYSHELNDNPADAEERGTWNAGISGNTVIGQGDVGATPLQMASGYATFANGGTVWRPQLVYQVTSFDNDTPTMLLAPEQTGTVPFQPGWHEAMASGFEGVTQAGPNGRGTAYAAFSDYDQAAFPVAGKTGTAQATNRNDTSLFAAYAPVASPTIAMATVVEFAGFGSEAAVPITRRVMDALASVGGDLARLNEPTSRYRAPEGGWFDVEAAQEEFVPTVVATAD
ncbi:MAG TPA: penicillin-binding transpeptidase domain-containing protein [Acidimicrobiales bacterium]|nr:penicillin-binding transpeptidase domain-containing protein [Acidimicrobiales bacterium]